MLKVEVKHDDEKAEITTAFDYEMGAAIVAAGFAIQTAEEELGHDIFGSDVDREHFFAFVSAVKTRFDLEEAL